MSLDVVGFGALNLDKLYRVDKMAERGDQVFVTGCIEAPGGSAANAVVGLARLGHKVGYVGKVGSDKEGKLLLKSLADEKVDTRGVIVSKEGRSGVVIGFVDKKGERTLYVDPGVNDALGFEEVDEDYVSSAKFLHMTSFVGEKPFEAQKKLLRSLSTVTVSFDPGELYVRKGLVALRPILKRSYVVFPNEMELRLLTGKGYAEGAKILIKEGVSVVAVKLGERGCYVTDGKEDFQVPALKVRVVDTTGAGDAFCAGFLHGLLTGKDLYACGNIANFVAGRKIERAGAREGLPRLSDLPRI